MSDDEIQIAEGVEPCLGGKCVWTLSESSSQDASQKKPPAPLKTNSGLAIEVGCELAKRGVRYSPQWEQVLLTKWRKIRAEWETKHGKS